MKRILLALTVLMVFTLVGCESKEKKLTAKEWAVEYAIEYVIEEHGDGDYMVNIDYYQYYYVDGIYTRGLIIDEEYACAVYKVTVTYLGDVYEGTFYTIYVGVTWEYSYTMLDFNSNVSILDKRFIESKIYDVDTEEGN